MKLIQKENDYSDFIINSEKIIKNRIELWNPKDVFITRIDNWFDEKWLGFSGIVVPGFGAWKGKATIPPFHPNRVENCDFYEKGTESYEQKENPNTLHIYQESTANLKRYVTDFSRDGLFIWYSGNSKINGLGSLMFYFLRDSECEHFFITLSAKKQWKVSQSNGITNSGVNAIID